MLTVLCPVTELPSAVPGHLLFGSGYFEEVAREDYGKDVSVRYLLYPKCRRGAMGMLLLNVVLAFRIMVRRHDVLYFRIDPDPLLLLSVLKRMGIYRKPIYAWKYTPVGRTGNRLKDWVKRLTHSGFTKIFMVTENHVGESVRHGIMRSEQLEYLRWGEDLRYVDSMRRDKDEVFTFITTGKAHRDMKTLCEAFSRVKGARLKIYTVRRWADYDYSDYLSKVDNDRIEVVYSDEIRLTEGCRTVLDFLFTEIHRSSCALSICLPVNFGVGYTQVLDSMACGVPVIATQNPDNPIDLDSEDVGVTVPPADPEALAEAMSRFVGHPDLVRRKGEAARRLIESHYNIRQTAHQVLGHVLTD